MEVISTTSATSTTNTNFSNNWGHHRYSSVSLASAASCESFHTCIESSTEDFPPTETHLTSRVSSFLCLEDVQEEDSSDPSYNPFTMQSMVMPLKPQQQAPMSAPITLARLALTSDFGILKRTMENSKAHGNNNKSKSSKGSNAAAAVMPPVILTVQSKSYQRPAASSGMKLEELTDDVQLQILSFVSLEDVRALMSTNRRYRRLLFTRDAQNLWSNWCSSHQWASLHDKLLIDDLSLPTAARPDSSDSVEFSHWHQQANMLLLLSMAQSQPTDIDVVQLNEYHTHHETSSRNRRRRFRQRVHTTDGTQPLLKYQYDPNAEQNVVQFTGRPGQGDRCVRSNKPFPRPRLIDSANWVVSSSQSGQHGKLFSSSKKHSHNAILDLFCRSARAISPPRPAWRPFVAPFYSPKDPTAVHLTPRFVSYFEVSILAGPSQSSTNDCVAVGVATESFDWHSRMPGWDASSFGYHGDDGGIFHSSGGMLRKYGPSYGRGDVVGCGIDHVMGGIFFTLNGEFLGYAWTGLPQEVLERDMYPVVGIDTNDLIHCNFGAEPFQYDLKSLIVKHEELVHQSLSFARPRSQRRSSTEC